VYEPKAGIDSTFTSLIEKLTAGTTPSRRPNTVRIPGATENRSSPSPSSATTPAATATSSEINSLSDNAEFPRIPLFPAAGGMGEWANSLNARKEGYSGLNKMLANQLAETARRRAEAEALYGEAINPEIYRYQAPMNIGTYISPKDLGYGEYAKSLDTRKKSTPKDFFERVQQDPMMFYKNFNLLKDFQTSHGRIKHRTLTGLSNVNQRKVAKAIRRSIGIGLLPSVYRHPELLKTEQRTDRQYY